MTVRQLIKDLENIIKLDPIAIDDAVMVYLPKSRKEFDIDELELIEGTGIVYINLNE